MKSKTTFGVHFTLRPNKSFGGKDTIYVRIVVNKSRCELALKCYILKDDWNSIKGAAKAKNDELIQLNSYLEEVRAKLFNHYRELKIGEQVVTTETVKNAYLGIDNQENQPTLLWLVKEHNLVMEKVITHGTMKNYYTTAKYLKAFMEKKYASGDIYLKQLKFEFITAFEHFIRTSYLKENDPCTNNGTMKHLERLKKMVAWAVRNEWIEKHPFTNYKLKFKRQERDFLNELELSTIENTDLDNPMLQKVRDLFVFCCYTGLAYIDLTELMPDQVLSSIDGVKWIKTSRAKTGINVNVPLLLPALSILERFNAKPEAKIRVTLFPKISNQEMNRSLKIIAQICGIKKYLTFHLARHTFATTVTLMNGVPIETISKMLGHSKLSTTMIYAKITQSKVGMDMGLLQNKLIENQSKTKLKVVK